MPGVVAASAGHDGLVEQRHLETRLAVYRDNRVAQLHQRIGVGLRTFHDRHLMPPDEAPPLELLEGEVVEHLAMSPISCCGRGETHLDRNC
jgi:hypothetical protein